MITSNQSAMVNNFILNEHFSYVAESAKAGLIQNTPIHFIISISFCVGTR